MKYLLVNSPKLVLKSNDAIVLQIFLSLLPTSITQECVLKTRLI